MTLYIVEWEEEPRVWLPDDRAYQDKGDAQDRMLYLDGADADGNDGVAVRPYRIARYQRIETKARKR